MTINFDIPLVSAHDIAPLRLAGHDRFAQRAARLQTLAIGHAMAYFLRFCADIATAQQACFDHFSTQHVVGTAVLRDILQSLQQQLRDKTSQQTHAALMVLLDSDDDSLQQLADGLRAGHYPADSTLTAALPLLGAALQVQASLAARQTDLTKAAAAESKSCPACGGLPVASVLRRGESGHAVRYACCSMCASEWHISRVKCVSCGNTKGLQYRTLATHDAEQTKPDHKQPHGQRGVQELECCDECHGALKMVSLERDAGAEPFADDLASLALDLLAGDMGYGRIGFNPYFLPGHG